MNVHFTFNLMMAIAFLWIGFVSAISFMESWLKFKAPGVTLTLGLGIGSLVFKALNKVEWAFAALIGPQVYFADLNPFSGSIQFYTYAVLLLLLQSLWLLPLLHQRARQRIQGKIVPPSPLHFYFIVSELLKVTSLFAFGINLFNE